MAAYLGYTVRMKMLFCGWPVMVNDTHTRRRSDLAKYSMTQSVVRFLCNRWATCKLSQERWIRTKRLLAKVVIKLPTLPLTADQTFNVLSSEPLTTLLPQNSRHVITWSSCPFSTCNSNERPWTNQRHHQQWQYMFKLDK